MANFDAPLDEEDAAMEPPTDKWAIEDYDPALDDPPLGHHHQGDDPPDLGENPPPADFDDVIPPLADPDA